MTDDMHKLLTQMGFARTEPDYRTTQWAEYHHAETGAVIREPASLRVLAASLIGAGAALQREQTKTLITAALSKLGFKF